MAEARSEFLKSNTTMTRSQFKNFLHETRSNFAQSNPKRKRAASPPGSVKDLRMKRVSVGVDSKVKSDVQDDTKKSGTSDVNVDVNVEQRSQISDEVKLDDPNENKSQTPVCPRSKLVQNSSSISFKKLLPYLKNLTEDESSGIKICHSYDQFSNNGKNLLQDDNIMGGLRVKAAEASDEMNMCNSLVTKNANDADSVMNMDVIAEQSVQIFDEVRMENLDENKSETPQSKLVQNSSSVGFRRLLPYLKNLIEDESSGIKICQSYDCSSNNEKILLQNSTIMGRVDGVKPAEASNVMSVSSSLVNKTEISSSLLSRLIGNQNSPSYRRLLPYLNDLAKEDSSRINTADCNLVNAENNTNRIQFQSSDKVIHSGMSEDTAVDDIDPILKKNSSCSLEVFHKPINKELDDEQLDDIIIKFKEGTIDLSQNGTDVLDVTVDCNTDIVQSTSDANSTLVDDEVTILKTDDSHSSKTAHKPTNEELNDQQIDGIGMDQQKGMNNLTRNDAEIFEISVNYNTDAIQCTSPDANLTNDSSITDAGIVELSVNHNTGIVLGVSPDANTIKYNGGFQSTPPDADIVNKLNAKNVVEGSSSDIYMASESNGEGGAVTSLADKSVPKKNLSPDSCPRSKLYRNSSSFSYRRLLPYLTSLAASFAKNVPDLTQSQPSMATSENGLVEKSVLSDNACSSSDHDLMETHMSEDTDHFSEGNNHLYNHTELENLARNTILAANPDFEFEMVQKSSSTPSISSNLSVDELSGGEMIANKAPSEEVSPCRSNMNQFIAPKKGILKKNYSKECKGKCMCLDCDLYRVNAEKAFEFSKRQMLCANDVVDGLIKEMSCLRKTMENSAVTMVNGSDSYTVLQADQRQVKDVCQRAHKVEEQAKSYMRQMFFDLNNHCRSPGPKVTFSDIVQEKSHP